jgi:hypothetical protein
MTAPKYTAYDRRVGVDPVKKVRLTPGGELEEVIGYHYGTIRTFLARVTPDGCHLCFSHKPDNFGYVHIRIGGRHGKNEKVHRVAYRLQKGEIPDGMVVRHTCDQPSCLNPDHLIIGTHAQNVADRVARNRSARGIKHGRAKLTSEQADYIRHHPEESRCTLARRFKVDPKTIQDARSGKNWKLLDSIT